MDGTAFTNRVHRSGCARVRVCTCFALVHLCVCAAQTAGRVLPGLSKFVVTKNRAEILPLLAAAVAAHPVIETRLGLIHLLLTVVHKPTEEDRAAIVLVSGPVDTCAHSVGRARRCGTCSTQGATSYAQSKQALARPVVCGPLPPPCFA